jgi:prepilin-type N-terminal cleavage/methylation domain-containing protein
MAGKNEISKSIKYFCGYKKKGESDSMYNLKNKSGFTMIELVVVIAVLAILVTLAAITYKGVTSSAQDLSIRADMNTIDKALDIGEAKEGVGTFKGTVLANTVVGTYTDINGDMVYNGGATTHFLDLYPINSTISSYYKKLAKPLSSYVTDTNNNVYYIGKFAQNPAGLAGPTGSPTIVTGATFTNGDTDFTITGSNVIARGASAISARGIVYSTDITDLALPADSGTFVVAEGGTTTGAFNVTVTDNGGTHPVTDTTTYYARAYATNTQGTSYGTIIKFVTETTP